MLLSCVWILDLFILEILLHFLSTLYRGEHLGCVGLVDLQASAGLNMACWPGLLTVWPLEACRPNLKLSGQSTGKVRRTPAWVISDDNPSFTSMLVRVWN